MENMRRVNKKQLLIKGQKFKYARCTYEFYGYSKEGFIYAYEIKKGKRQPISGIVTPYFLHKCDESTDIKILDLEVGTVIEALGDTYIFYAKEGKTLLCKDYYMKHQVYEIEYNMITEITNKIVAL